MLRLHNNRLRLSLVNHFCFSAPASDSVLRLNVFVQAIDESMQQKASDLADQLSIECLDFKSQIPKNLDFCNIIQVSEKRTQMSYFMSSKPN